MSTADASIEVADPRSPDAIAALSEYFAELSSRFSDGFDPGDTLIADAEFFEQPHGAFLLVTITEHSGPVGCGAVRLLSSDIAEIKRMWISEAVRGAGLGRQLLETLEDHAMALGAQRVRLDTNSVLLEAIAMYESAGYHQIDRYNDNPFAQRWFEKSLSFDG